MNPVTCKCETCRGTGEEVTEQEIKVTKQETTDKHDCQYDHNIPRALRLARQDQGHRDVAVRRALRPHGCVDEEAQDSRD